MTDYNLGRAYGTIDINANTSGAKEAQAAMAATAAEAEVLDKKMGAVNRQFEENQKQNVSSAEKIRRHREQVEELRRAQERYHDDYQRKVARTIDAEAALEAARAKSDTKANEIRRLSRDAERAKEAEERALRRLTDTYERYNARLSIVRQEVENFNAAHLRATSTLSNMRFEAERAGQALENLSSKLSSVLRVVGQGGIMGVFGLSSASNTTAMGAAGLSGLSNIVFGVSEAAQQLSGVIALLPAVVNTAVISLGTLATAFHGVGESLGALNDPNKFLDSLRELSPLMQQAMSTVYSFGDAMRGVRKAVQDSFVAPMVAQIQPLIYTWLPQLMNTGRLVADQYGKMGSEIMRVFMTPEMQQSFSLFTNNMVAGMERFRGALAPVLHAWMELSNVGGSFLPRLGEAITDVANRFNNWVTAAANNGRLARWIDSALDGFTNLGHIIENAFSAFSNIMDIGSKYGGTFLETIRSLSEEFLHWTESAGGMQTIANFFDLIHQAAQAMHPIIKLVGEGLSVVFGALTRLAIQEAPGTQSFFKSIVDSLRSLAQILPQIGPSIAKFVSSLGDMVLQIVEKVGPQLPKLFEGMMDAMTTLMPLLVTIVDGIVSVFNQLSPEEIKNIALAAIAVKGLAEAFGILAIVLDASPVVLITVAIGALGVAIYEAYQHWEPFRNAVDGVWHMLSSMAEWIGQAFSESGALKPLADLAEKAFNWGRNVVSSFVSGLGSLLDDVGRVANEIADEIDKKIHVRSPTREGPLSKDGGAEGWGVKTAESYAAGLAGGTGAVASAATGIAGSASGITGQGFSSAGTGGRSGTGLPVGGPAQSGFRQYIDFLTNDLRQWNSIFQQSFNLVQLASNQIVQGIRIVASIWNRGDNPLTQPGGIAGPPKVGGDQQQIPWIQGKPIPGKPPIPALAPLGGPAPSQEQAPGVPNVVPHNTYSSPPAAPDAQPPGPGSAGGTPPGGGSAGQAAPQVGARAPIAGGPAPAGLSPDQYANAQMIINGGRARGMTDQQISIALAIAADESNISSLGSNTNGGNALVGGVSGVYQQSVGWNPQGSQDSINKFLDTFQANLRAAGPGADPLQVAVGVQQHGAPGAITPYQGTAGDKWYMGQVAQAMQGQTYQAAAGLLQRGAAGGLASAPGNGPIEGARFAEELSRRRGQPASTVGAAAPAFQSQPYGLPTGTNTGGYGSGSDQFFPPWVMDLARQYNVKPLTYPRHQETDRAGERGYAPNPQNLNRGIDWVGSREDMQRFAEALIAYGGGEGADGPLEQVIYQAGPGGKKYGLGGAGNIQPSYYPQSGDGSYDEHGGTDSGAHVHTRFSGSVPPTLGTPPANPPATTVGQVAPTSTGDSFYNQWYPNANRDIGDRIRDRFGSTGGSWAPYAGAALAGGLAYGGYRLADRALLAYRQSVFNQYDALAQRDVIRGLSPGEEELLGRNPRITFGNPPSETLEGLNVNLGRGIPPGTGGPVGDGVGLNRIGNVFTNIGDEFRGPNGWRYYNPDIGQFTERPPGGVPIRPGPTFAERYPEQFRIGQQMAQSASPIGAPVGEQRFLRFANSGLGRALGGLANGLALPGQINQVGDVTSGREGGMPRELQGAGSVFGAGILGSSAIAGGSAALGLGFGATTAAALPIVGGFYAASTFGAGTGDPGARRSNAQLDTTPYDVTGQGPAGPRRGQSTFQTPVPLDPTGGFLAGPLAPPPVQTGDGRFGGRTGRLGIGAGLGSGVQQGQATSQPVHVTNAESMPGGSKAPIREWGIRPTSGPGAPKPGDPGFVGPVPVQTTAAAQPAPGPPVPQRQTVQTTPQQVQGGQIGQHYQPAAPGQTTGITPSAGQSDKLPFNAQSPLDAYSQASASVGNIASSAFTVFSDVITNIKATADITESLVRGPSTSEDIVNIIQNIQTYLKTAADTAMLVSNIGGLVAGAGAGDPTGGAGAVGGGIQAIAGMVSAAIQGVNNAITLGIDIYHQVGKYAGFLFGSFLGGSATGPLGGNVRMMLNTRTNQLLTYNEENPLNKNSFNIPGWQRTYQQQPTPPAIPAQVNIYTGPGQTPAGMMQEAMWNVSTGSGPVASVAGAD